MQEKKTLLMPDGVMMSKQELKDMGLSYMTEVDLGFDDSILTVYRDSDRVEK